MFGAEILRCAQDDNVLEWMTKVCDPWDGGWRTMRCDRGNGLLEFGGFGFGLLEEREVGVGVLPEGEECGVGGARFCGVAGGGVGASDSQVSERVCVEVQDGAGIVDDFLELGNGLRWIAHLQVG